MIPPRHARRGGLALALALALAPTLAVAGGVPRSECFPIERLEPAERPEAEALLLKMLDTEALFTIVGGLKPVSSSFWTSRFEVAKPDLAPIERTRRLLEVVRCGDALAAEVLVFDKVYEGRRVAAGWVAHRPTLARAIRDHAAFFGPIGVTPNVQPAEVVTRVEFAPEFDRLRGSGYLFGYPDHAVDFFVASSEAQKADPDHKLVPRTFLSAPTVASATGKFTWAVPKDQPPTEADRALLDRAAAIMAAYRHRRDLYIGPGKPGVVALLRDWFDDGTGLCDPANASLEPPSTREPAPAPPRAIASQPAAVVEVPAYYYSRPVAPRHRLRVFGRHARRP